MVFQTLMKGPRVLFIASLIEPTTVLVVDLVCVLACESQVFSGMCLSHPDRGVLPPVNVVYAVFCW